MGVSKNLANQTVIFHSVILLFLASLFFSGPWSGAKAWFVIVKWAVLIYPLALYSFKRLFKEGRWTTFILFTLGQLLIATGLDCFPLVFLESETFLAFQFNGQSLEEGLQWGPSFSPLSLAIYFLIYLVINGLYFFLLLSVASLWYTFRDKVKREELEKEKLQLELKYIRQQQHPHFLFNNLNNLYVLIDEDPNLAKRTLLQLSDLIRYTVYQSQEALVSAGRELRYIKNYIELQQLRSEFKYSMSIPENGEAEEWRIPPFTFFILVENAFKHGDIGMNKEGILRIEANADSNGFALMVENSVGDTKEALKQGGFGLSSLRRLLEAHYPKAHELELNKTEKRFKANLHLWKK